MAVMALTRSSIGKKVIMAVTGFIWIGYVVVHMYGNLKVFLGSDYFNEYAEGLRVLGEPIFGAASFSIDSACCLGCFDCRSCLGCAFPDAPSANGTAATLSRDQTG